MGQVSSTSIAGQKREGRGVDVGAEHGGDEWQPAEARVVVARVKKDSRGGLGRRPTSK
jgi:hypothetical protein